MPLSLVRRAVKGSPLTAADHDGNLNVLEAAIESGGGGGGGGVSSVTGTAPIAVANGTTTPAISISPASGSVAGSMASADFTKLAGIATAATANASDASLRDRATHTGTQTAATVSDFPASSRAQTEAMLTAGTNVTLTPSGTGAARSIQISATAGGGGVSSVTGTAPIASSGGATPAISITAATNSVAGSMSAADKTKLDGIATGATANATDAQLRDRSTHTGTQAFGTLTGTPTTLAGYGIADAQPLDSDLTSIAALTTTAHGRGLLTGADAAATRTQIGLSVAVLSDVTGITGATRITNMVSLTQAQYDAITPNSSTFYVII